MRKLFLILGLIFVSFLANSQGTVRYLGTPTELITVRGSMRIDSTFAVPNDTLMRASWDSTRRYLHAKGDSLWLWSPSQGKYILASGSGGGGGGSMVYPAAGIAVSTGSAWTTSITDNSANWNTAYTDRLKWDGGGTGLVAATGRTSLGATDIGSNLFTLTNNATSAKWLRVNADNTVSYRTAAETLSDIGAGTGTVNSGTQYRLGYYATTGTAISELAAITANRALISDANGLPTHSSVTNTELGYVSGVTSAIQTQLDSKQPDIQFKDEGVNQGTSGGITNIDFTGAGVTASESGGTLTVNIAGGGGGVTEPAGQIVVGDGTAVDSYDDFKWDNAARQLLIQRDASSVGNNATILFRGSAANAYTNVFYEAGLYPITSYENDWRIRRTTPAGTFNDVVVTEYGELLIGYDNRNGGYKLQVNGGALIGGLSGGGTGLIQADGSGGLAKALNIIEVSINKEFYYNAAGSSGAANEYKFIAGYGASQGTYAGQFNGDLWAGGALYLPEQPAPSTPGAGTVVIYPKTDGKLYAKNDAGTEYDLTGDVTLTGSQTLTNKRITKRTATSASSASLTIDGDAVDMYTVTALAEAMTINAPSGTPTEGQTLLIRIKDNGTARALTFNAIFRAGTDIALPTTTVINKTMYLSFVYNTADTKWDFVGYVDNI